MKAADRTRSVSRHEKRGKQMEVDLVNVQTVDGIRLDGTLRRPASGRPASLDVDLVIQHHGQAGNFYGASMFNGAGEAFLEAGCAVLRVNSRGHDQMFNSPRGRLGASGEIIADC